MRWGVIGLVACAGGLIIISITGGRIGWAGMMGGRAHGMIHDHNVVRSHIGKLGAGAGIYGLCGGCGCWDSWLLMDECELVL